MNAEPMKKPDQRKAFSRFTHAMRHLLSLMLHNWPWKLLAIFVAVCLWAGLISQDPTLTRERVFSDASIGVSGADSLRRNSSLIVISGLEEENLSARMTVDVPQRAYTTVAASNYNPRVDLTRITEPGEQTLKVLTTSTASYGTVTDVSPSTITVEVDQYVTNYRIPVSADIKGSYPEGFYGGALTLDPSSVAVSGPASIVNQLARISVEFDASSLSARAGTVRIAMPMRFLDREGKELDSSLLEVSSAGVVLRTILAQQTLYPTRLLSLSTAALTSGEPADGYRVKSVTVTPATVLAAGDEDDLSAMDELFMNNTVDLSGASESFTQTLRLKKPSGLEYLSVDSVTVCVEIEPVLVSRTFSGVKLFARGVSAKKKVSLSARTLDVALTGPQNAMEGLRAANVTLFVDVSNLEAGEYELPVQLHVEDMAADRFSYIATPATIAVTIVDSDS